MDSVFKLRDFSEKMRKDGSPFLIIEFSDRSGRIIAKIWDQVEQQRKNLLKGAYCRVKGEIIEYNNRLEIKIDQLNFLEALPSSLSTDDFAPLPKVDLVSLQKEFEAFYTSSLKTSYYIELYKIFWQKYGPLFCQHPGAQKVHHAFPGGLMLHTLSMARLSLQLAAHYNLDAELLLIGVLLHDSGKLKEFSAGEISEITIEGGLTGHIILGLEIFNEIVSKIPDFPQKEKILLKHMLVSHHGEKEFGSVETPKTIEAYVLHILDLLDSRINIYQEIINSGDSTVFSEYHSFLKSRILISGNFSENR